MANLRKLTKAGMTAERTAGKPKSKAAAAVSTKVDKVMGNPDQLKGGKAAAKASAVTKGIVKQYSKETKKK